jgi:hypothetical protein
VREAFPEYADIADAEVLTRIVGKYPGFKTWIREETDGSPPLPIAVVGQSANAGLRPPPAYFGARPKKYSRYAMLSWIDEPLEYMGWVVSTVLGLVAWVWIFRERRLEAPKLDVPGTK